MGVQGRRGLTDDRTLFVREAELGCIGSDVLTRAEVASDQDLGASIISVARGSERRIVEDAPEV